MDTGTLGMPSTVLLRPSTMARLQTSAAADTDHCNDTNEKTNALGNAKGFTEENANNGREVKVKANNGNEGTRIPFFA